MKLTSTLPMLVVDDIAACIGFYKSTLEYAVKHEIKDANGKLTWVLLSHGDNSVMMVERANLDAEIAPYLKGPGASYLFHSMDPLDVDRVTKEDGVKVLHGPRATQYHVKEVHVMDVSGHMHMFIEWVKMDGLKG
ncbi:hypothetical protein WJX72_010024 [[Myrmecia] bisecta]|uniref:Glyoxalase/fosfomycin resistance/dioxygenase domain-containing protein n=1 Tax=[Myrmecia] bisecta TaxID=41462 RepID=A0AAW1P1U8_9CHLO